MKEEASLDIKVCSIIYVESHSCWFRFTFAGECVGGTLKDAAQEDEHSIEAKWIPVDDVLNDNASGLVLRYFRPYVLSMKIPSLLQRIFTASFHC